MDIRTLPRTSSKNDVRVHVMPAFEEIFVTDIWPLFEEHGNPNIWLLIDWLVEFQVWVGKFVGDWNFP